MAGLALRLAFMPFTMHTDLLFINYYPHFLSHHGVWDIYGYFGDHYVKQGYTYYPPLIYYACGFFQWALKPLYGAGFEPFMENVHRIMYSYDIQMYSQNAGKDAPANQYLTGLTMPQIWQYNFLMKIPYLAADAAALGLLSKTLEGGQRTRAACLWLFFPVSLFASYVFGQYRVLSALCVWGALFFVRRRSYAAAMAALGTAALLDVFPFILALPAIILFAGSLRARVRLALWFAMPLVAVLTPLAFSSKGLVFYAYASDVIKKTFLQSITYSTLVQLVQISTKIIFGGLFLGLTALAWRSRADAEKRGAGLALFVYVSLALLLALYGTTGTMVHYFMWALPLFIYVLAEGAPWPSWCSWVYIACLFFFNLDSRQLNLGLLIPLGPDYFSAQPSLHEVMDRFLPWNRVVAGSRTIFSMLSLYFIYRIVQVRIRPFLAR